MRQFNDLNYCFPEYSSVEGGLYFEYPKPKEQEWRTHLRTQTCIRGRQDIYINRITKGTMETKLASNECRVCIPLSDYTLYHQGQTAETLSQQEWELIVKWEMSGYGDHYSQPHHSHIQFDSNTVTIMWDSRVKDSSAQNNSSENRCDERSISAQILKEDIVD